MATTIVTSVTDGVQHLVEFIIEELGNFAHTIALNVLHDVEVLLGDPSAITAAHLGDLWITVKDQIATAWATLAGDFEAKVSSIVELLKNINWVEVASSVIGLSMPTLTTLARVGAGMMVAGVIAAI